MRNLADPCNLGECDAFLSHSWHDDAEEKWTALEAWCESFRAVHAREPKLWLDKICIDQLDIKADLQCLPVLLAGCNEFLVLSGQTYTSRLWCIMEMFVFMSVRVDNIGVTLRYLARDHERMEAVRKTWLGFNCAECKCFNPNDKKRILEVISQFPGGLAQFDEEVIHLSDLVSRANYVFTCFGSSDVRSQCLVNVEPTRMSSPENLMR